MPPALSYSRILQQTRTTAFAIRCWGLLALSVIYLVQPAHTTVGLWIFGGLAAWMSARVIRPLHNSWVSLVDMAFVVAVAANFADLVGSVSPPLGADSPALAVIGTSVLSMTIEARYWVSFPVVAIVIAAFAHGISDIPGVGSPLETFWVYFFASQWIVVAAVRIAVERAAHGSDTAAEDYARARALASARRARRQLQREHWATLHDTAAATLMMIGAGATVSPERVRAQARRDIDALRSLGSPVQSGSTNLRAALVQITAQTDLTVRLVGGFHISVPADVATALIGAVRESLTNVERHSGTTHAEVRIESGSVTVIDRGSGFEVDVESQARPGYSRGLRASVHGRMADIGGSATIASAPGVGTTVALEWTPAAEVDRSATASIRRAAQINRIFHYGLVFISVLYSSMFLITALLTGRVSVPTQLAFGAVVAVVLALGAYNVLIAPLPQRVMVGGLVVVAMVVCAQGLSVDDYPGSQSAWTGGILGFSVIMLTLHQRWVWIVVAMVLCWSPNVIVAGVKGQFGDPSVMTLACLAVSNPGVPIVVASWVRALATNARRAEEDGIAMARILEAEEVAAQVADEHRKRYENLSTTTIPLLQALADGDIDSGVMRERASIESARLRRMFAASETAERHFAAELLAVVGAAEERGVTVGVDIDDDVDIAPGPHCDAMVSAVAVTLAAASYARVVVTSDPAPELSIVCDAEGVDVTGLDNGLHDLRVRCDDHGGVMWVQICWESDPVTRMGVATTGASR